jgi:hypothetical protein
MPRKSPGRIRAKRYREKRREQIVRVYQLLQTGTARNGRREKREAS